MKVAGLDGREYVLDARGRGVGGVDHRRRSGPHLRARDLLRRLFPLVPVLEEVPLPGTGGLTADFVILSERAVVEVHGAQHLRYTPHFHGNFAGYLQATRNDRRKSDWCDLNNFRLVVLLDTETDGEWERIVRGDGGPEAAGDGGGY